MSGADRRQPADRFVVELTDDDGPVVAVGGEIDIAARAILANAIASARNLNGGEVTIDLRDTTFMDAAGLAVLAVAARDGVDLRLRGPRPPIRRVIEICGLDELVAIEP